MTKSIESLARGVSVLEEIHKRGAVTLSELHRTTEINKATLLRILRTLVESGWVIRSDEQGTYQFVKDILGAPGAMELIRALRRIAGPVLAGVCNEFGAWAEIWGVQDDRLQMLGSSLPETQDSIGFSLTEDRLPLISSAQGLAYLAFCSPENQEQIRHSILTRGGREALMLQRDQGWLNYTLETIRKQGYSRQIATSSHIGHARLGMEVIAVPVLCSSEPLTVLSLSWLREKDIPFDLERKIIPRLKETASSLAYAVNNE